MFRVSDETYNDNIHCAPTHYNALRAKPTYPPALIENNVRSLRPFPNTWIKSKDEWKYFRDERKFAKRCLFGVEKPEVSGLPPIEGAIHLRSIDNLGNWHLLGETIKFPHEDYIFQVLGSKKHVYNKRNNLEQRAPGDKSYKAVEYSNDFYNRVNRDWRSQKYSLPNRSEQNISNDIIALLDLGPSATDKFFSTTKHSDLDYEQDKEMEKQDEIRSVKELDSWRAATPLKLPFKVLDLSEKDLVSKKYRPKVTR